jgi:hypothetical protein
MNDTLCDGSVVLLVESDQEVNGQPQAIAYIQASMRAAVRARRS